MQVQERYLLNPQHPHLTNNSQVERFNVPIASSFSVFALRCNVLIDQIVMDEYTSSGGELTNQISERIRYQVWLHKCDMIGAPVTQDEVYVRYVKTV